MHCPAPGAAHPANSKCSLNAASLRPQNNLSTNKMKKFSMNKVITLSFDTRAAWSKREEDQLRELVHELHGKPQKWEQIAKRLGTGRTGPAVFQKWFHVRRADAAVAAAAAVPARVAVAAAPEAAAAASAGARTPLFGDPNLSNEEVATVVAEPCDGTDLDGTEVVAHLISHAEAAPPEAVNSKKRKGADGDGGERLRKYIEGCGGGAAMVASWVVRTKQREGGKYAGTWDTTFVSPKGRTFRSMPEVARHIGLLDPKPAPKKKALNVVTTPAQAPPVEEPAPAHAATAPEGGDTPSSETVSPSAAASTLPIKKRRLDPAPATAASSQPIERLLALEVCIFGAAGSNVQGFEPRLGALEDRLEVASTGNFRERLQALEDEAEQYK